MVEPTTLCHATRERGYCYCLNNPTMYIDATGARPIPPTMPIEVVTIQGNGAIITVPKPPERTGDCGGVKWRVKLGVGTLVLGKPDNSLNGWLIQHITIKCDGDYCNPKHRIIARQDYYEAWQVVDGTVYHGSKKADGSNTSAFDQFDSDDFGEGTEGTCTWTGSMNFVSGYQQNGPPWLNWGDPGYPPRGPGILPYSPVAPKGWDDMEGIPHTLTIIWTCCPNCHVNTNVTNVKPPSK